MFATMWELHSVENVLENGRNEDIEEQVAQVKTKLFDFMDVLRLILAHSTNPLFKEKVLFFYYLLRTIEHLFLINIVYIGLYINM